ncbi:MAG: hypothetical protein WC445_01515 [Patescibacteria group bacterium]
MLEATPEGIEVQSVRRLPHHYRDLAVAILPVLFLIPLRNHVGLGQDKERRGEKAIRERRAVMVDFLGPMIGVAVAVTLVPDLWLEPLPDIFLGTFGAHGNQPTAGTRGTSDAVFTKVILGECSLAA